MAGRPGPEVQSNNHLASPEENEKQSILTKTIKYHYKTNHIRHCVGALWYVVFVFVVYNCGLLFVSFDCFFDVPGDLPTDCFIVLLVLDL